MIIRGKRLVGYGLFVSGLTILLALGIWQLMRGLEKEDIESRVKLSQASDAKNIDRSVDWSLMLYQRASLAGQWHTDETMLLDNRLYEGRPGYEVITPFSLKEDGQRVLINRGWVAKPVASQITASIDINPAVNPSGQLYLPQAGFTLGESISDDSVRPLVFLYYDFQQLSDALGKSLASAVMVLDDSHPASFRRIWEPSSIQPQRHYAYAMQWWGLALTLLIFGVIWRRKL